jgi:hypothetical protein
MYYSPEGLLGLFLTFCVLVAFIYPGYLIVNNYYKRKGEDTSLPQNSDKTVWGGFIVSLILFLALTALYSWSKNG